MVSTLAYNVRDVGSNPALGKIFPMFIMLTTLFAMTIICKATHYMNPPWLVIPCIYVIVSITRLTIPGVLNIVISTDLSGKELHKQVGGRSMAASGSLAGIMVSTWTRNARDVD